MIRGKTQAETCRLNGWSAGTILVGDEGFGPEKIRITAIGDEAILARTIQRGNGEDVDRSEGMWNLNHREWSAVLW